MLSGGSSGCSYSRSCRLSSGGGEPWRLLTVFHNKGLRGLAHGAGQVGGHQDTAAADESRIFRSLDCEGIKAPGDPLFRVDSEATISSCWFFI